LRTQTEFDRVFAQNRTVKGRLMSAWAADGDGDANAVPPPPPASQATRRLGMKVTKKTFRLATERNRAKRLVRESFRLLLPKLSDLAWDLVVVPRRGILDVKEPDVRREMSWACRKLGLGMDDERTASRGTTKPSPASTAPETRRDGFVVPLPETRRDGFVVPLPETRRDGVVVPFT